MINDRFTRYLLPIGTALISLSLALIVIFFYTPIKMEIMYRLYLQDVKNSAKQVPATFADLQEPTWPIPDTNFSLIIPKIGARSKVVSEVDPFDSNDYQRKLTQGVAHAKGTAYPGQEGNTFIFSHSTDTLLNAGRYNAVFYLLNKIEVGDKFFIVYEDEVYTYQVVRSAVVEADQVQYLQATRDGSYATLMTCWPAGTAWKRLIVEGELYLRE